MILPVSEFPLLAPGINTCRQTVTCRVCADQVGPWVWVRHTDSAGSDLNGLLLLHVCVCVLSASQRDGLTLRGE